MRIFGVLLTLVLTLGMAQADDDQVSDKFRIQLLESRILRLEEKLDQDRWVCAAFCIAGSSTLSEFALVAAVGNTEIAAIQGLDSKCSGFIEETDFRSPYSSSVSNHLRINFNLESIYPFDSTSIWGQGAKSLIPTCVKVSGK